MKRSYLSLVLLLVPALFSPSLAAQVKIAVLADRIDVNVDGKLFTSLQKGEDAHKIYLAPIFTASGKRVTRGFPMEKILGEPTDHPHQRGVWMGIEHVSGMNLWELDPADPHPRMGKIVFQKVIETHDGPESGGLTVAAQWLNSDGTPIIDETLVLTFYAKPVENRTFDVDMRLKAIKLSTFEDARDGVIGIRLNPAFDEKNGGKLRNAEGVEDQKIEGLHSHWADWETNLDGEKVGVAVMDHPNNYRAPTTWIERPNALLFANPFAQRYYDKSREDGSLSLQTGDELRLRYRFVIHPAGADINKLFKEYSAQ